MSAKKQEWWATDADEDLEALEAPPRGVRLHNMHLLGVGAVLLALVLLDPYLTAWVGQFRSALVVTLSEPTAAGPASGANLAPPLSAFPPAGEVSDAR